MSLALRPVLRYLPRPFTPTTRPVGAAPVPALRRLDRGNLFPPAPLVGVGDRCHAGSADLVEFPPSSVEIAWARSVISGQPDADLDLLVVAGSPARAAAVCSRVLVSS